MLLTAYYQRAWRSKILIEEYFRITFQKKHEICVVEVVLSFKTFILKSSNKDLRSLCNTIYPSF